MPSREANPNPANPISLFPASTVPLASPRDSGLKATREIKLCIEHHHMETTS
jgi:hypothetical protein